MPERFNTERLLFLQAEQGRITERNSARVRVALGYPNRYGVGMANLGFQTIYQLFNRIDGVQCERFFTQVGNSPIVAKTLETGESIATFDIVAFSIPFELDYTNLLLLLQRANIPLLSQEREDSAPLILAGGASVTLNPEPLAPFVDLFVIGEGEAVLPELMEVYLAGLKSGMSLRRLLAELAEIPGIYVPRLYLEKGATLIPYPGVPPRVNRLIVRDLDALPILPQIVSPHSHFSSMLLVEIGRGCGRSCRFCAAQRIYGPLRFKSKSRILREIQAGGHLAQKVGLISSAISDLPWLEDLSTNLVEMGYGLGVSSLRIDALTEGVVKALARSGLRTITIAPEAGTEQMRKNIGKEISDDMILSTVDVAAEHGIRSLKLYFIIGLPGETDEDIDAIGLLLKRIGRQFLPGPGSKRMAVSINPLIPKPFTPFQWVGMEPEKSLQRKLGRIEVTVRRMPRVRWVSKSPRHAVLQGILARGDRRVGMGMYYRVSSGMNWDRAWRMAGVHPWLHILRPREEDEPFPWEIVDAGIHRESLWRDYSSFSQHTSQ